MKTELSFKNVYAINYKMLANLKSRFESYCQIDTRIQGLNKEVHSLRNDRKNVESELVSLLQSPDFSGFTEVRMTTDNSLIQIQRPNQWSKAWTMSKKDLQINLKEYFDTTRTPSADECFKFIVDKKTKTLVSTEFAFTRIVPE